MRKLLLTLAVLLSAVGFTTHAQDTDLTVAKILEGVAADKSVEVKFRAGRTKVNLYYLGVVGPGATVSAGNTSSTTSQQYTLVATTDISNNTTWIIELGPEPEEGGTQTYYVKNKDLSVDGKAVYLDGSSDNITPNNGVYDYNTHPIIVKEFTLTDGNLPEGETPKPYVIQAYTGSNEEANGLTVTGITGRLKPADGGDNSFINGYGGFTGTNVFAKGHKLADGGSSWDVLTDLTAAAKDDFSKECDAYLSLITYLNGKTGLLGENVATTATTAITAAKDKIDTNFEEAQADAKAAMTALYKGINSINVLLKSNNNLYLANHRSVEEVNGSHPTRVHAHDRFGFASVWQLSYDDGTTDADGDGVNDRKEGLHIKSYYRGDDGIGMAGSSLDDDGFYLSFATLLDNKSQPYSGVIFINDDGWFLSDNKSTAGDDEAVLEEVNSKSTLWDIEPVAMPMTIEVSEKTMTINMSQSEVPVLTETNTITFTSNKTGIAVPDELKGLTWSIKNDDEENPVAIITPTDKFAQYDVVDENGKVENGYNGYGNATITPLREGTATIVINSVISETIVKNTGTGSAGDLDEVPACEITLVVKKAPLTAIEASHDAATFASNAKEADRTFEVTVKATPAEYDLTAGTLTAALTKEDADDIAVEIAAKAAAEPEVQLTAEGDSDNTETEQTPAPAVYVAKVPADVAPGTYNLKVTYNEGEGSEAITPLSHTAEATVTVTESKLESLTASIPAETKIAANATERTVTLTVVPTPASVVVAADQLTVKVGEKDCTVAAPEAAEGETAAANTFTVTIPTDLAVGQQTLSVSYKETAEAESAINATATEDGTLALEITKAQYTVAFDPAKPEMTTDAETQTPVTVAIKDGETTIDNITWTITFEKKNGETYETATGAAAGTDDNAGKVVFTGLEAGTYRLTINSDDCELTKNTLEFTVAKADAPVYTVTLSEGETAVTELSMLTTDTKTLTVALTLKTGTALDPAPTDWTATLTPSTGTATTITPNEGAIELTGLEAGTYTLTIATESTDYQIDDNSITVTVTAPVIAGEIKGIDEVKATDVAIEEGTGTSTITGKLVIEPANGTLAEDASLTLTASSDNTNIKSVEVGDVKINEDGTFEATATVTLADDAELTEEGIEAAVTITPSVGEAVTVTIKVTPKAEAETELPVEQPKEEDLPTGTTVDITTDPETGIRNATIDFNATPAEDGEPVADKPVLTVTLPVANDETIDTNAFTATVEDEEGNASTAATVNITAEGVEIDAKNAKIGDIIRIIIRKIKQAVTPETQSVALLADDTETGDDQTTGEGSDEPAADDNIVMTIELTIYGVEFTKAPASVTLPATGSIDVTIETNDCTPDDADVEITATCGDTVLEAVDGVITFTEAGTYTVVAKAGENYAASTTITVKDAPTVTGIEAVNADAAAGNATIYDLQGRKITRVPAAGIYIVNGIKTLVK